MAGIPDGADVDLGLIRLPANSLIFPAIPQSGETLDLGKPRKRKRLKQADASLSATLATLASGFLA